MDDGFPPSHGPFQTLAAVGKLSVPVAEIDPTLAVLPGLIDDKGVEGSVAGKIGEGYTTPDEIIELLTVPGKRQLGFAGSGILHHQKSGRQASE